MCFIVHWWQGWFETYPSEPMQIMTAIDRVMLMENPDLVGHLERLGYTARHYAWPLLRTMFTKVLEN